MRIGDRITREHMGVPHHPQSPSCQARIPVRRPCAFPTNHKRIWRLPSIKLVRFSATPAPSWKRLRLLLTMQRPCV